MALAVVVLHIIMLVVMVLLLHLVHIFPVVVDMVPSDIIHTQAELAEQDLVVM